MTYLELLNNIKEISYAEIREDSENYLEAVFTNDKEKQISDTLSSFFQTPYKPAGQDPSKEALEQTTEWGGIRKDQTLYLREQEGLLYCAMLWPWSDQEHTTLKIAQFQQKK